MTLLAWGRELSQRVWVVPRAMGGPVCLLLWLSGLVWATVSCGTRLPAPVAPTPTVPSSSLIFDVDPYRTLPVIGRCLSSPIFG